MTGNDDSNVPLIYAVIQETLANQHAQKSSLETKASTLIAFAGGMFALLIGARETLILLPRNSQVLILMSVSLFVLSVIFANIVTWVRKYRTDPNPEKLAEKYLGLSKEDTQLQLTSNLIGTWKANRIIIERNANFLRLVFLSQLVGFILLGIALFLSVL